MSLPRIILQGGSRETIALTVDVSRYARQIGRVTVPFETVLRAVAEDRSTGEWIVRGRVRLPFALASPTINLGEISGPEKRAEFELQRHPLVSDVEAHPTDPSLAVRLVKRGESGGPDQYEVLRSEGAPRGPFRSLVEFTARTVDEQVIPPIPVVVFGVWSGGFAWSPRRLVLASSDPGLHGEMVEIRSRSGAPLVIKSVSSESEALQVEPLPSAEPSIGAVSVRVRDNAAADVNVSTKVSVSVTSAENPGKFVIEIPVIAYSRPGNGTTATRNR